MAIVSIGIVSANQLDNTSEDNIILKPLELNNESLGTWTAGTWIEVDFLTNKSDLHDGD